MDAYKDHPARKHATATPRVEDLPDEIGKWCKQIPAEEKGDLPDRPDRRRRGRRPGRAQGVGRRSSPRWAGTPRPPGSRRPTLLTIDRRRLHQRQRRGDLEHPRRPRDRERHPDGRAPEHVRARPPVRPPADGQERQGRRPDARHDRHDVQPRARPYVSHFAGHRPDGRARREVRLPDDHQRPGPRRQAVPVQGRPPADRRLRDRRRRVPDRGDPARLRLGAPDQGLPGRLHPRPGRRTATTCRASTCWTTPTWWSSAPGAGSCRRRSSTRSGSSWPRASRSSASGRPATPSPRRPGPRSPRGRDAWAGFDAEVLGGHYTNHHEAGPTVAVAVAAGAASHPILEGVDPARLVGHGSLYKVSPLAETATPAPDRHDPRPGPRAGRLGRTPRPAGSRVFYTSLGQADDFAEPAFNRLLRNAIDWASGGRRRNDRGQRPSTAPQRSGAASGAWRVGFEDLEVVDARALRVAVGPDDLLVRGHLQSA